jgi:hypothetical protein
MEREGKGDTMTQFIIGAEVREIVTKRLTTSTVYRIELIPDGEETPIHVETFRTPVAGVESGAHVLCVCVLRSEIAKSAAGNEYVRLKLDAPVILPVPSKGEPARPAQSEHHEAKANAYQPQAEPTPPRQPARPTSTIEESDVPF